MLISSFSGFSGGFYDGLVGGGVDILEIVLHVKRSVILEVLCWLSCVLRRFDPWFLCRRRSGEGDGVVGRMVIMFGWKIPPPRYLPVAFTGLEKNYGQLGPKTRRPMSSQLQETTRPKSPQF